MRIEIIARAAHEVVRAYYGSVGLVVPVWEATAEWHSAATINAVLAIALDPNKTAAEHHHTWMSERLAEGWVLSETENVERKEHPYLIAYDELPQHKQQEDVIFMETVRQMLDLSWAVAHEQGDSANPLGVEKSTCN